MNHLHSTERHEWVSRRRGDIGRLLSFFLEASSSDDWVSPGRKLEPRGRSRLRRNVILENWETAGGVHSKRRKGIPRRAPPTIHSTVSAHLPALQASMPRSHRLQIVVLLVEVVRTISLSDPATRSTGHSAYRTPPARWCNEPTSTCCRVLALCAVYVSGEMPM
jgi:hypothetical protein